MTQPTSAELASRLLDIFGPAIQRLKHYAQRNPWSGKTPLSYRHRGLLALPEEPNRVFSVLLSFDIGYHASGWWRNSQYDRCWHLSVAVLNAASATPEAALETPELVEVQGIARAFFGDDVHFGWVEPPASAFDTYRTAPASRHTYHVRIFVDPATGQAIQPQGEVYDLVPFADGTSPEKIYR